MTKCDLEASSQVLLHLLLPTLNDDEIMLKGNFFKKLKKNSSRARKKLLKLSLTKRGVSMSIAKLGKWLRLRLVMILSWFPDQ